MDDLHEKEIEYMEEKNQITCKCSPWIFERSCVNKWKTPSSHLADSLFLLGKTRGDRQVKGSQT